MTSISSNSHLAALSALRGARQQGQGVQGPSQLADLLFSKLDSSGQGFVKKADIEAAVNNGSPAAGSVTGQDIDALFTRFDADGDGNLTRQEFTDSVKRLADELSQRMRLMDAASAIGSDGQTQAPTPTDAAAQGGAQLALGGNVGDEAKTMQQLMKLLQAYGGNEHEQQRQVSALQAVTA